MLSSFSCLAQQVKSGRNVKLFVPGTNVTFFRGPMVFNSMFVFALQQNVTVSTFYINSTPYISNVNKKTESSYYWFYVNLKGNANFNINFFLPDRNRLF